MREKSVLITVERFTETTGQNGFETILPKGKYCHGLRLQAYRNNRAVQQLEIKIKEKTSLYQELINVKEKSQ